MESTVFYPRPLSKLEQIAKLVRRYMPLDQDPPTEELCPLLERLNSDLDRDTANMIITGTYPQVFSMGKNSTPVHMQFHNRYTPTFVHNHDFCEIVYVCCGSCSNVFKSGILPLHSGDLLFLPPKMRHALSVFSDDTMVMNFWVRTSVLEQFLDTMPMHDNPIRQFCSRWDSNDAVVLQIATDYRFSMLLQRILQERETMSSDLRPAYVLAQFQMMLITLLEQYTDRMQLQDVDLPDIRMESIIELIRSQLNSVTLHSLAYQLGYSYSYLSRIIKQFTGRGFSELRRDLRLEQAARLLRETDQPVDAIALSCGYETRSQFYAQFKSVYHTTPAQYRSAPGQPQQDRGLPHHRLPFHPQ